jgi:hypothetical protein
VPTHSALAQKMRSHRENGALGPLSVGSAWVGRGGRPPASRELGAIRALTPRTSIAATDQALATLRLEITVNDTPWFPASSAQRGADHAAIAIFSSREKWPIRTGL